MSLAFVRGFVGAVCLWTWVLSILFMSKKFASLGFSSLPIGSIQLAAFGGLACALLAVLAVVRRGGRGPEPSHAVSVVLGCVPPALMLAVGWAVRSGVASGFWTLGVWALAGASAAYALRRSLALVESLACGMPDERGLRATMAVMGCAAVLAGLLSRMDALAATALTFCLVPAALLLLPQGRLSLAPRTEGSRAFSRSARSQVPRAALPLTACLAALGLVFGFHTSVGDVLYTDRGGTTIVYVVLLAAFLVTAVLIAPLPSGVWRPAAQVLCALSVVAIVPMLFLPYDPVSVSWMLCQNGLLLCTACCCAVLAYVLARGGFGAPHETDGAPGLVGAALFLVALIGGWLLGLALTNGAGVGGLVFKGTVVALSALLLACVLVLGWGASIDRPHAQPTPGGASDGALDGATPGTGAEDPAPDVPAGVTPPAGAYVSAGRPSPQACAQPSSQGSQLARRCNEVAWHYGLSEREHDVLILLARGLNAQQVAERMVVSRNTVKSHMAHIYAKLSIHTRAELDALLAQPPRGGGGTRDWG